MCDEAVVPGLGHSVKFAVFSGRKYAFRFEELGEEGYEILMDLFDGTYSEGRPPKLNVYTMGGPITS